MIHEIVRPRERLNIDTELELEDYSYDSTTGVSSIGGPRYSTYQSPFMRTGSTHNETAPVGTQFDNNSTDNNNFKYQQQQQQQRITRDQTDTLESSIIMPDTHMHINRYSFGFEKLNLYPLLVRWRFSDVVFCALLLVLFIISWEKNMEPFQRQFFINDLTISHPFAEHERVTGGQLLSVSFGIPTFFIVLLTILFTPYKQKSYVLVVSLLGLYISLFTNCLITELLKVWIGRHRPDFLARCVVKADAPLNTMVFAKDVCTTDNKALLMDGFKTTPSGHSSISFSGLGYLSIWLCGQFLVSHIDTGAWRTIVSGIPLFGASYVAFSRTEDYRHHFVDVILGSLLGSLIAWWSYRRIFPSITDEFCFLPYQLIEEAKQENNGISPYHVNPPNGYQLAGLRDDDLEEAI